MIDGYETEPIGEGEQLLCPLCPPVPDYLANGPDPESMWRELRVVYRRSVPLRVGPDGTFDPDRLPSAEQWHVECAHGHVIAVPEHEGFEEPFTVACLPSRDLMPLP